MLGKRTMQVIVTTASAGALVLGPSLTASAAVGELVIDGQSHTDPVGCFQLNAATANARNAPSTTAQVVNNTNMVVLVHSGKDCSGTIIYKIGPGNSASVTGRTIEMR